MEDDVQQGAPPVEDQPTIATAPEAPPDRAPAAVTQGPPQGQESPGLNPPPVQPNMGSEAFQSGAQAQEIQPERWQDLGNRFAIATEGSSIGQLSDWLQQRGQEKQDEKLGVTKISPEEAQRRFPGMPEPFTKPIDPYVAELQYNRYQSMKLRQQWAMHGGDHPFEDFGLAVGVGAIDPVNVALGVATGGAGELAGIAESAGNSFLKNLLISGAKNTVIGGALAAGSYEFEKSQHTAPELASTLEWGAAQIAGMSLLHAAWIKAFSNAESLQRQMPKDLQESALRTGLAQEESGARVDITPQATEARARMAGQMEGQVSPYRFQPLEHPSQRPFYAAVDANEAPVRLAPTERGFHAVDDPMAANNMAGEGKVGEIRISEGSKFVNADEPLPDELLKSAHDAIEKAGAGDYFSEEDLKKLPASEVLRFLSDSNQPAEIPQALESSLRENGYAGVRYTAQDELGGPVHNGVVLLDPAQPSRVWQADPELAKGVTPDQKEAFLEQSMGADGSKTYTPEIAEEVHAFRHEASLNSTDDYLDPIIEERLAQIEPKLQARAEADPGLKTDLEEIKKSDTSDKQEQQARKDFSGCITGGLV